MAEPLDSACACESNLADRVEAVHDHAYPRTLVWMENAFLEPFLIRFKNGQSTKTGSGQTEAKGVFRRMQSGDVSLAGVHFEHLVNNTMLPFINPATQLGKKRDSSSPLLYRNEQFTKTGSGQT
jgi:hypothetical protein